MDTLENQPKISQNQSGKLEYLIIGFCILIIIFPNLIFPNLVVAFYGRDKLNEFMNVYFRFYGKNAFGLTIFGFTAIVVWVIYFLKRIKSPSLSIREKYILIILGVFILIISSVLIYTLITSIVVGYIIIKNFRF